MNQDCKSVTRVNNTNWVAETTQGAKFHYTLTTKPVYGTLNGTWVEWDNSDNPEMLYHCCCPTRLDKYDSSCCTLDSECPDDIMKMNLIAAILNIKQVPMGIVTK